MSMKFIINKVVATLMQTLYAELEQSQSDPSIRQNLQKHTTSKTPESSNTSETTNQLKNVGEQQEHELSDNY